MKKYTNLLRQLVSPEEIFDENTGHKLSVINNEIVELKFCSKCCEWHPLGMFYNAKSCPDGLSTWCKTCTKESSNKRRLANKPAKIDSVSVSENPETPVQESQETGVEPRAEIISITSTIQDTVDRIVERYEDRIKHLNSDIDSLKLSLSEKPDLTKLSEKDIETILKTHNVPPRILFNAIRSQEPRYLFSCYDTVTGLTIPIKTEIA